MCFFTSINLKGAFQIVFCYILVFIWFFSMIYLAKHGYAPPIIGDILQSIGNLFRSATNSEERALRVEAERERLRNIPLTPGGQKVRDKLPILEKENGYAYAYFIGLSGCFYSNYEPSPSGTQFQKKCWHDAVNLALWMGVPLQYVLDYVSWERRQRGIPCELKGDFRS